MRFTFVGDLSVKEDGSRPYYRSGTSKNGNPYASVSLGVVASQNNRAYVEAFGVQLDKIKTMSVNGERMTVDWENRKDDSVVNDVAYYRKNLLRTSNIDEEFVSTLDFCKAIKDNIADLKDGAYAFYGNVEKNVYEGKVSDRFIVQNIAPANSKNGLTIMGDFYFNADSIDASEFSDNKKVYVNGYIKQWFSDVKAQKFIEQQLVIDASNINFDVDAEKNLFNYKLRQIHCSYEDGKIKNSIKSGLYKIPVVCRYVNGAEEIPFDESELTPNQKEAIALGLKTVDDFKPNGKIYGNRITEWRLVDFRLNGEYADGALESDEELDLYMDEPLATDDGDEDIMKLFG